VADPQPSTRRLYAIGLTANLVLLALYALAGAHIDDAGAKTRLYWVLGGAALLAGVIALVGRVRSWQERRGLLVGWPVVALIVTVVVGAIDPSVTRDFPGTITITITITITFAYVGLACGRWRSLAMVPLGIAAFVVGGSKVLPGELTTVVLAAAMWVIVPAWLIAQLRGAGRAAAQDGTDRRPHPTARPEHTRTTAVDARQRVGRGAYRPR
jgi:hypothetical protein